ncbi:MAG: 50S ribosomal protein L23 [Patescibacteria group bacterium]
MKKENKIKDIKVKAGLIKNPRVTEKATNANQQNVYVFDVVLSANKSELKKAIFQQYKFKPVKINIISIPRKKTFAKGKKGVKSGPTKKALIYLKKGETIES